MFRDIPLDILIQTAIVLVSVIVTWVTTRLKRSGKELPPTIDAVLSRLNYEDLKSAYDWAMENAWTPEDRQKVAVAKLKEIAAQKGITLSDSVANFLVELAVQAAKSGWQIIRSKL